MAEKKHLILGAGPAALSALEAIRRVTLEEEVKMVTREDCPPYWPAGLPYLLSGAISEAELERGEENYFRNLKSTLVKGKEAVQILPRDRRVIYADGTSEGYHTLLIATGAEPVKPPIRGWEDSGVLDFRILADCRRLLEELKDKRDTAVLGAGIAGMNLAAALLEKGCRVHVLEKAPQVLPLSFPREAAEYIRDAFIERGVSVLTGRTVAAVKREKGKIRISFSDGGFLDADLLINAAGVKGRISFLEGSGIEMDQGLVVDERMRTNLDGIYAAGDAAQAPDFFTDRPKMTALIPSAVNQGRVAGTNMAGGRAEYEGGIAVTALNYWGKQAFSMGLPGPVDDSGCVWKQKSDRERRYRELIFQDNRIVGAAFVNDEIDPGTILSLIRRRLDMTLHLEALFERTKPLSDPWLRPLAGLSGR